MGTIAPMIELKTDPLLFTDTWKGVKKFEIRLNDRGYKVGDVLRLRETAYSAKDMVNGARMHYTGRACHVRVLHILEGDNYGLANGWVVMSIEIIGQEQ